MTKCNGNFLFVEDKIQGVSSVIAITLDDTKREAIFFIVETMLFVKITILIHISGTSGALM